jgi:hypothetical protein
LNFAQRGERHEAAKTVKGFGGAGVLEVIAEEPAHDRRKFHQHFLTAINPLAAFYIASMRIYLKKDKGVIPYAKCPSRPAGGAFCCETTEGRSSCTQC